jgi:plasmid stability protein
VRAEKRIDDHHDRYREIEMAQLIVRDLEDDVKTCLQKLAARHGRSFEAEVRDILRNAARTRRHNNVRSAHVSRLVLPRST